MLGVRKEEEERRLGVWCSGCRDYVDVMEWETVEEHGKAVCPWCSENFYVWTHTEFDPADVLGLRAHSR